MAGIQSLIIPLVGVALVLVIGFLIFAQTKEQVVKIESGDYCGAGWNYDTTERACCNTTGGNCNSGATDSNRTSAGFGYAYNSTETTQKALDDVPGWLPIIVVAVIGALLLGLVTLYRSR